MLVDLFSVWGQEAAKLIIALFEYIFPEYPKVGLAVFVTSGIFFLFYLVKGRFVAALKMAGSTLVTLTFLLYVIHILIKLYHVAI